MLRSLLPRQRAMRVYTLWLASLTLPLSRGQVAQPAFTLLECAAALAAHTLHPAHVASIHCHSTHARQRQQRATAAYRASAQRQRTAPALSASAQRQRTAPAYRGTMQPQQCSGSIPYQRQLAAFDCQRTSTGAAAAAAAVGAAAAATLLLPPLLLPPLLATAGVCPRGGTDASVSVFGQLARAGVKMARRASRRRASSAGAIVTMFS